MPILKIDKISANLRADKALLKQFPLVSHSLLQKLFRKKLIKVNNKKITSIDKVFEDDEVRYPQILEEFRQGKKRVVKISSIQKKEYFFDNIIKATPDYIAINKPSLLASQGGSKVGFSIDDIIKQISEEELKNVLPNINFDFEKMMLTHRLDINTTGVMVVALNKKFAAKIGLAFKERKAKKTYLAECISLKNSRVNISGVIDIPLQYGNTSSHHKTICIDSAEAKTALTRYRIFSATGYNDVYKKHNIMVKPKTGRKHQIRAHMAHIGLPLLGDEKYNNFANMGEIKLHAYRLKIASLGIDIKAK